MNSLVMDNLEIIIKSGDIDKLGQLYNDNYKFTPETFKMAIKYNQLDIINFLHEELCPYDELYITAIENNNLNVIKLLHKLKYKMCKETFECAVKHNNIKIVDYLYNKGCPLDLLKCIGMAKDECLEYLNQIKQQRIENGYVY